MYHNGRSDDDDDDDDDDGDDDDDHYHHDYDGGEDDAIILLFVVTRSPSSSSLQVYCMIPRARVYSTGRMPRRSRYTEVKLAHINDTIYER